MNKRVAIAVQRRGKIEQFELAYEPLRIGSASHCDVRLGPDEAAPEAVLLEPCEGAMKVRALASDPPLRLHGAPMSTPTLVRDRARLELGVVTLTLELVEPQLVRAKGGTGKTVRQLLMLGGVALGYAYVLAEPATESALAHPLMPAPLFTEADEPSCRQAGAEAKVYAQELLALADAQRERWPFAMHDGVQAVSSFQQAGDCFEVAGDARGAQRAREASHALAAQVEEELAAHRVRLEWYLDRRRLGSAAHEVNLLRELLGERDDPYARWLAAVAHELQTMHAMQATTGQE